MSYKRKPTVIKFNDDYEKQKFMNWALNKSEPNEGLEKAKNAMRLVQQDPELNTTNSKEKKIVVREVSTPTLTKVRYGKVRLKQIIKDGENAVKTNYRRG